MKIDQYLKTITDSYYQSLGLSPKSEATPEILTHKKAIIVSPHPDDEAISGGLCLRLKKELGFEIINVPYGLGSKLERQAERKKELALACKKLGFTCTEELSSDKEADLKKIMEQYQADLVITCHDQDGHKTHEACSLLVQKVLSDLNYKGLIVFHEFWKAQENPNLLVELSEKTVLTMMEALLCHEGEISRNPYHLRLPFTLGDNSRRGGELIAGVETKTSELLYSMVLTMGKMSGKKFEALSKKHVVSVSDSLSSLF